MPQPDESILDRMERAVERVRERLRRTTRALDAGGVSYAIVCGNAVNAWIETVDTSAIRNTPDVEALLRVEDIPLAIRTLEAVGFQYRNSDGQRWFQDCRSNSERDVVRIIAPVEAGQCDEDVDRVERIFGFRVLNLESLVRLHLHLYRLKHKVQLRDLIDVGLVDDTWPGRFTPELSERLHVLLNDPDG